MLEKGVISTGVDSLIKLVKERTELSVPEASKLLNVPEQTVEAWAAFLEEENLLSMRYKFTTPYLLAAAPEAAKPAAKQPSNGLFAIPKKAPAAPSQSSIPKTSDVHSLVSAALSSIEKADFKSAKEAYSSIREAYENLPLELEKKRESIVSDMLRLNKEYLRNLDKFSHASAEDASRKIRNLIPRLDSLLRKKDVHAAVELFAEIREAYKKIPDSLVKEKVHAEEQVLGIQERVIEAQQRLSSDDLKAKLQRISELLPRLERLIDNNNVDEAAKVYSQVNSLRKQLPAGFLEPRVDVENRLLPLYNRLMNLQLKLSKRHMESVRDEILKLLAEIHLNIEKHSFAEAFNLYGKARALYLKIPYGFIDEKTGLQKKLLSVLSSLLELKLSVIGSKSLEKSQKIKSLLNAAETHLKSKNTDVAKKVYKEMEYLLSSLPEGFSGSGIEAGTIDIYSKLISSLDKSMLEKGNLEGYLELLHILIRNHELIQHREFDLMLVNSDEIIRLSSELPGLEKRPQLSEAVSRAAEEAALFRELQELKKAPKDNINKVKELLEKIYSAYSKLAAKCPDDSELFSYAKAVYLSHLHDISKKRVIGN